MGLFKKSDSQILYESELYRRVADEIGEGRIHNGLWAKAQAKSKSSDPDLIKAAYIEMRVELMEVELSANRRALEKAQELEAEERLIEQQKAFLESERIRIQEQTFWESPAGDWLIIFLFLGAFMAIALLLKFFM